MKHRLTESEAIHRVFWVTVFPSLFVYLTGKYAMMLYKYFF